MQTIETVYADIKTVAEEIRNDEHAEVAVVEPGDVVRQGDIYIVALDAPLPGKPAASRQLAPGTTQGSRHVAEGDCEVLEVDSTEATDALNRLIPGTRGQTLFIGPEVRASSPVTFAHPEHGDRTCPPGDYLVVYQRAFAEEIRRQMD